jgi:hypothetical protein
MANPNRWISPINLQLDLKTIICATLILEKNLTIATYDKKMHK